MSNKANLSPRYPHRDIFVALCTDIVSRQVARDLWKRLQKGRTDVPSQYHRIFRTATQLQMKQIAAIDRKLKERAA